MGRITLLYAGSPPLLVESSLVFHFFQGKNSLRRMLNTAIILLLILSILIICGR